MKNLTAEKIAAMQEERKRVYDVSGRVKKPYQVKTKKIPEQLSRVYAKQTKFTEVEKPVVDWEKVKLWARRS